jgi:apolipoprotein N-acyltransferase
MTAPIFRRPLFMWPVCGVLSAALLALAFPKASLWPLAFFASAPLFAILHDRPGHLRAFAIGTLYGACHFLFLAYWLGTALLVHYGKSPAVSALFLALGGALPHALLFGVFFLCARALFHPGLFFNLLVLPSLWILTEYTKEAVPFLIPWGHLGYAVLPFTFLAQAADLCGVYGLSFIAALLSGASALVLKQWPRMDRTRRAAAVLSAVLAVLPLALYGAFRIDTVREEAARAVRGPRGVSVAVVQADERLEDRWSGMGFSNRMRAHLAMSRTDPGPGGSVIVWAETVLNQPGELTAPFFAGLARELGPKSLLVAGGVRKDANGGIYNTAYALTGQGELFRHDKHILLPYSERPVLVDFLGEYASAPDEFLPGPPSKAVRTPQGVLGLSICFEVLYPGIARRAARQGADFLVNISNDSWFGDSSMPYTHLLSARARAIETRRFLLRASNSGVSAIVSPAGEVLAQTMLFTKATARGTAGPLSGPTFYTLHGDWILLFAALAVMARLALLVLAGK